MSYNKQNIMFMDTIHKLVKIEKRSSQSQKFHLLDLTMSDQKKPSQSFMLIPLMKRFPVGPVLTHGESLTLFGLSNRGWPPFQLWCHNKMPYGIDVLHQPALHPIFSYCVG